MRAPSFPANLLALPLLVGAMIAAPFAVAGPALAAARPPVIDVHVHTSPARYNLVSNVLAMNGITRFVNLSGGSPGRGLEESVEAALDYDGRILVCANIEWAKASDPDFGPGQAAMLSQAAAAGARCLKIPKALGLSVPARDNPDRPMPVDDPILDPIWAAAARLELPVFIHIGDPKAFFEPVTRDNERWDELSVHPGWSFAGDEFPSREELLAARDRLLVRHPNTTFIGVHFANNPEDVDYVEKTLELHPNLYVDIAARLPEIGRHPPDRIRALFVRFQDRILFGTDLGLGSGIMLGSTGRNRPLLPDIDLFYADHYRFFETTERGIPHPTPIQGRWTIDAIGLPPDVIEKVYHRNALKLLWGEEKPSQVDREAIELAPNPAEFHSF